MASAVMYAIGSVSGNQPEMHRRFEDAAQVFLLGVPVQIEAGNVAEWAGTDVTTVLGISKEAGSNLDDPGVPKTTSEGHAPNQPDSAVIPRGAKLNDGRVAVEDANDDSLFFGQIGPAQTRVVGDIEMEYGLTKDTDDHWYVDKTKTDTDAVVKIIRLDQYDARGVHFMFKARGAAVIPSPPIG